MSEMLILTPQGRHSLQRNERGCQVGIGVGVGGELWEGGGWGGARARGDMECGFGGEVESGGVQERGSSIQRGHL